MVKLDKPMGTMEDLILHFGHLLRSLFQAGSTLNSDHDAEDPLCRQFFSSPPEDNLNLLFHFIPITL